MKYFLHTENRIRIVHDLQEFECEPDRFAELEPDYPGMPEGVTVRYWTPERAYFEGGGEYDAHDCGQYCERVASYTQYPAIFADVTLSKTSICACAPDSITFTAVLKDADGVTLPINYNWFVRLTHEAEGDVDRVLLDFVNGVCAKDYTFLVGNPLGTWYLDESKFDKVTFDGVTYEIHLTAPIEFVAYRQL